MSLAKYLASLVPQNHHKGHDLFPLSRKNRKRGVSIPVAELRWPIDSTQVPIEKNELRKTTDRLKMENRLQRKNEWTQIPFQKPKLGMLAVNRKSEKSFCKTLNYRSSYPKCNKHIITLLTVSRPCWWAQSSIYIDRLNTSLAQRQCGQLQLSSSFKCYMMFFTDDTEVQ
jgi:hypothetical protein